LIVNALDAGYRVFMTSFEFDAGRDVPPGVEPFETNYAFPDGRMIELQRKSAKPLRLNTAAQQPGPSP
jgi:hypothetical protein